MAKDYDGRQCLRAIELGIDIIARETIKLFTLAMNYRWSE